MCKWGTYKEVEVTVPADLSHTGEDRVAIKKIDSCLAPMVRALNEAGIKTRSCCCGHGKRDGHISLWDDTELVIKWAEIHATFDAIRPIFKNWKVMMKIEVAFQGKVKGNRTWWVLFMKNPQSSP